MNTTNTTNTTQTNDPLKTELARLDTPTAPDDLLARCLNTVPAKPRGFPWRGAGWSLLPRLALTAAVVAGIAFVTTRPPANRAGNGKPVSASAAFAASLEASKRATYWHAVTRGRTTTFYVKGTPYNASYKDLNSSKFSPRNWNFSKHWMTNEAWFDEERGNAHRGGLHEGGDGRPAFERLYLPSGLEYLRNGRIMQTDARAVPLDNALTITHHTPPGWPIERAQLEAMMFRVPKPSPDNDIKATTMKRDIWKGRSVTVFTVTHAPFIHFLRALYSWRDREMIYADAQTGRIIAEQMYTTLLDQPRQPEELTRETIYDYNRPPVSVFNVEPLRAGASKVRNR